VLLEEDYGVTACGSKSEDHGQERYIIKFCLLHLYCLLCLFCFFLSVCGGVHKMPFSCFLLIRIMFFWG